MRCLSFLSAHTSETWDSLEKDWSSIILHIQQDWQFFFPERLSFSLVSGLCLRTDIGIEIGKNTFSEIFLQGFKSCIIHFV